MIEEDIIELETAVNAFNKGFDCYGWSVFMFEAKYLEEESCYLIDYKDIKIPEQYWDSRLKLCPQSLLQKWLREECGVFVGVECNSRGKYRYHIYNAGLPKENFPEIIGIDETTDFEVGTEDYTYDRYEQALEDGLNEAMKLW